MIQNNSKGRTIFGVIAVIAIIALLCLLFIYICKSTRASRKAKEIAEAVVVRSQLYCPQIKKYIAPSKTYAQNGPYGTTITLQNEKETFQPEEGKIYFSVVVDTPSKSICKKLVKSDLIQADLVTIDDVVDGKCPGLIRFYFTCPYELDSSQMMDTPDSMPYETPLPPHFTFSAQENEKVKLKCKEPLPYEDKNGNCVECITASQCHESQDCVENMCEDCPEYSTRTVRVGQRIGTRNCYCQEGYQLNIEQNGCVLENDDWDIQQNCVGNHCSVCPENADHNKGQRIGSTDCYCKDGYLPRQTGASQWQCAKVVILYPEPSNQIIIHDEKYPVQPAQQAYYEQERETFPAVRPSIPAVRPTVTEPRPLRQQTSGPAYLPLFEDLEPALLPFPNDGSWNIQMWESFEITVQ